VRVVVGDEGHWFLEVDSHQDEGVSGTAYCFCAEGFLANGPDRWISPLFEAGFGAGVAHGVNAWNGDAATFIAGVNGHLRGGGEHARIVQSQCISAPSELRVGSSSGYLKSWAHSFFAGTAGGGLPAKFFQPGSTGGEFTLRHITTVRSWDMAPAEDAMCYFTLLEGEFNGLGEFAEIVPIFDSNGVERWRLQAQATPSVPFLGAAPTSAEVFTAARCYTRDQR
jgi:hypothetical protein